jgi:hypothetical protein
LRFEPKHRSLAVGRNRVRTDAVERIWTPLRRFTSFSERSAPHGPTFSSPLMCGTRGQSSTQKSRGRVIFCRMGGDGDGDREGGPNRFLAFVGLVLIVIAACGLFLHENQPLSGTFLFLGTVLVIVSVFEPRMEDEQSLSPGNVKINLAKAQKNISKTEIQRADGTLIPLDEARE